MASVKVHLALVRHVISSNKYRCGWQKLNFDHGTVDILVSERRAEKVRTFAPNLFVFFLFWFLVIIRVEDIHRRSVTMLIQ